MWQQTLFAMKISILRRCGWDEPNRCNLKKLYSFDCYRQLECVAKWYKILSIKKYHLLTAEKKFWIPLFLHKRRQRDAAPSTAFLNRQYFMQMCISFYFYVRQKNCSLAWKYFWAWKSKSKLAIHPRCNRHRCDMNANKVHCYDKTEEIDILAWQHLYVS